jgi:hypothetical protein
MFSQEVGVPEWKIVFMLNVNECVIREIQRFSVIVGTSRPLIGRWRDNSPPSPPLSSQHHRRLGRQGLARRRDANGMSASATSESDTSQMLPGMCCSLHIVD